jgi:lipopolysaccharide biosynthesis glycosyltransferase
MRIPVCFSSDNKYATHLGVSIASILKNKNEDDNLKFYVLDGGISETNKENLLLLKSIADFEIKLIKDDNSRFSEIRVYRKDHITCAAYFRLILPEVCNSEDKIIYLDCDLIVITSLREMLKIDLAGNYIGAVLDIEHIEQAKRLNLKQYINSGVLLINALAWRYDNITAKVFDWAKNNKNIILYHDQDILNGTLEKNIKIIDSAWNIQISKIKISNNDSYKAFPDAKIIHYIAYKPWEASNIAMKDLYYEYLSLTPWKNLKYKINLNIAKSKFKIFVKWLFAVHNVTKETKIVQLFGKSVIKFKRK